MRCVVALIALHLLVDFFDPTLPGAFKFDAEESVEVVRASRIDLMQPSNPVEPYRAQRRVEMTSEFSISATNALVTWAMPASRQWRRMSPPRSFNRSTSEDSSPASLAA